MTPAILSRMKGRWPSLPNVGAGVAVDAAASCAEWDSRAGKLRERFWNVLTSDAAAYGKSVWTRCLKLVGVKSCGGADGPTGPGFREATEATKAMNSPG
jgi:hypothetical protein